VQLAIDKATPGSVLHAVAEEGVATRDIARALGRYLDVPVESIPVDRAQAHFDWLGVFFGADAPASSARTRSGIGVICNVASTFTTVARTLFPDQITQDTVRFIQGHIDDNIERLR
jgi:hypothetical protein